MTITENKTSNSYELVISGRLDTGTAPELEAKDTARYEVGIAAEQYGVNIEEDECPEDAIDFFLAEHKEFDRFDVDGHIVNEKGERL